MSIQAKVIIAVVVFFVGFAYYSLAKSEGIGTFDNIRASGEINRITQMYIDKEAGFQRDENGRIVAFYLRDKIGGRAVASLSEPAAAEVADAEIVEILGHMHSETFIVKRLTIIK